jgi:regulatory protein
MKITALEPQARNPDRYNLSLDGRFALSLDAAVVLSEGLSVGAELLEEDVERLRSRGDELRLLDAAVRFLAPRPRSRAEVCRRLLRPHPKRPAPAPDAVERILDRLQEMELIDDRQFADFWVENRERFSPRSARALGQELRQRGVASETVEEVSDPDRDEVRALAAGRQRLRNVAGLDYEAFRARLGGFLLRRGFGYGVVRTTLRALWEETHGAPPDDDDAGSVDEESGLD